ncbi:hypothetical protein IWZ00DRAFT_337840 [Phyllosticta capitalensis]
MELIKAEEHLLSLSRQPPFGVLIDPSKRLHHVLFRQLHTDACVGIHLDRGVVGSVRVAGCCCVDFIGTLLGGRLTFGHWPGIRCRGAHSFVFAHFWSCVARVMRALVGFFGLAFRRRHYPRIDAVGRGVFDRRASFHNQLWILPLPVSIQPIEPPVLEILIIRSIADQDGLFRVVYGTSEPIMPPLVENCTYGGSFQLHLGPLESLVLDQTMTTCEDSEESNLNELWVVHEHLDRHFALELECLIDTMSWKSTI